MYCTKCGYPIETGGVFCPRCGYQAVKNEDASTIPVNQLHPESSQPRPPANDQPPAQTQSANRRKTTRIAIIVVASLALIACIALLLSSNSLGEIIAPSDSKSSASSTSSASSSTAEKSKANTSSHSNNAKSDSSTSHGSSSKDASQKPVTSTKPSETTGTSETPQSPPKTYSSFINLSNWSDFHDINIFLSNFAEWPAFYEQYGSFNRDSPNMKQLANWGMWHNVINNGLLETGSYDPAGAPAPSAAIELGQSNLPYTRRMQTEYVNNSLQKYFGRPFDLSGYNPGDGSYYETDGYLYEGLYRGSESDTCRFAVVDGVTDIGGSLVSVDFSIVKCWSSQSQIKPSDYWYGMSYDELASTLKSAGAPSVETCKAHAVVEVVGSGSDRTFQLASFSLS